MAPCCVVHDFGNGYGLAWTADMDQIFAERFKRLVVPMVFGPLDSPIALDATMGDHGEGPWFSFRLAGAHFWTSILFWVPIIAAFWLFGFLWNLALYSFLLIPIFHFAQRTLKVAL